MQKLRRAYVAAGATPRITAWHFNAATRRQTPSKRRAAAAASSLPAAAGDDPVVTPAWLASHLGDVAILDVRGRVDTREVEPGVERSTYIACRDAYLEGHIPGAVFWDWTTDGVAAVDGVPVQLLDDGDAFAVVAEARGVGTDRPVVVYDDGDGMLAARLWWSLRVHGHPKPLVLEGGYAAWCDARLPTELYEPCTLKIFASWDTDAASPAPQLHATADDVAAALGDSGERAATVIVDTRNAAQYAAKVRRGPRGGRIPGAVSLPRAALLDAGGERWLPLDAQRAALDAVGALQPPAGGDASAQSGGRPRVLLYCNGGVAACTAALALHRCGMRDGWAVYDGSWNEWGARRELPAEGCEGG